MKAWGAVPAEDCGHGGDEREEDWQEDGEWGGEGEENHPRPSSLKSRLLFSSCGGRTS